MFPLLSILSLPGLIYLSLPVLRAGYTNVFKERRIGVGIVDAVIVTSQFILGYFFALSLYLSLLHFSRKLVLKTRDTSRQRLFNIFGEQPRHAWLRRQGVEVEIPVETLEVGDIVVVNAGEMIPVDGSIIEGVASIDQHMLTGEAQPAESGVGDGVLAATVVLSGRISIRVDKAGPETVAAQIGAILSRTVDFKSEVESRGEVIADKSAWPMLAFSTFSFLTWGPILGVCVLKCHFGQNLRIIAPLSVLNFLNIAAQHRILVKDGRALELLHSVDTVVFDKTGTLTQAQPHVATIYTYNGYTENDLLVFAAAAEHKQTHPLARAILSEAQIRQLHIPAMQDATYEVGYGIKVGIGHKTVRVGSARFMEMEGIGLPFDVRTL
ncbi:MAG: HAD-IC family P-type ATPase, partial [Candidatus Tectomicrobia bacterium]|nr:HAD-IC family P-type ATPase [Candidatus Tectomicrobia bacterium]